MPDLSETLTVSAPALSVYDLVSDLPRMGEWSPECTRVTWSTRTPGPAVGARFVGHNRAGAVRWFTFGRVVDAVPGERFSFVITFGPIPVSLWAYDFREVGAAREVTESWTDHRPAPLRLLFRPIFGDRVRANDRGIRITLERLKTAAETA